MSRWLRAFRDTYLTADPRSLGLFRIVLGLVLLSDWLRRYLELDTWYTNTGLLPNHTLLWRPPANHVFSLFFVASSRTEAVLGFALCALAYVAFTLGFYTRLAHALALICRISLNSRIAMLENGGDMVLNLLCIFTLALPLGRRFSIDAWLVAQHGGRARSVSALQSLSRPALESRPVVSLAMFGLILQFAVIYFFNAISKQGHAWVHGSAVHFALHLDKFVTPLGVWMREQLPPDAIRALSWSVLATEWVGCALIVSPFWKDHTRLVAVGVLPLLHLGFALGLNLGGFSPAMMAFYPLLLTSRHWDALARWLARRTQPCQVELDPLDLRLRHRARVLRELDRFGRIQFSEATGQGYRVYVGSARSTAAASAAVLRALPWGFVLAWPLSAARPRTAFEPMLRGLLALLTHAGRWALRASPASRKRRLRAASAGHELTRLRWLSEAAVAVLMVALTTEVLNDNTSVPQWLRVPQPDWAKAVIEYPRLLQGWRMFAPEPPRTDSMIHIDALTADGRHVDPYNLAASRQAFPDGRVVPERMDQSQFFLMYTERIATPQYAAYRQAFLEWILAYPTRTGNPGDCLVAFDVYAITDNSPELGQHTPAPATRERFLHYTAPPDSSCPAPQPKQPQPALQARRP